MRGDTIQFDRGLARFAKDQAKRSQGHGRLQAALREGVALIDGGERLGLVFGGQREGKLALGDGFEAAAVRLQEGRIQR